MNNLSSYFGLVDAKIRASVKDLPLPVHLGLTFLEKTAFALNPLHFDEMGSLIFVIKYLVLR